MNTVKYPKNGSHSVLNNILSYLLLEGLSKKGAPQKAKIKLSTHNSYTWYLTLCSAPSHMADMKISTLKELGLAQNADTDMRP